jgi:hypothetical protein
MNPELSVPVQYKMSRAYTYAAFRSSSELDWGYDGVVYLASGQGIASWSDSVNTFEEVPGGICKLIGASGTGQKVPIEAWEFWRVA